MMLGIARGTQYTQSPRENRSLMAMSPTRTPERMFAVIQDTAGAPDVLKLVEIDLPGPTREVLVRVHAAGVNPTDWENPVARAVRHRCRPTVRVGFRRVRGREQTGPGVRVFSPGDEVFGMPRFPHPASAYAEFVTAPGRHFASKPANIDHKIAAALPLASLTAWQALVDPADVPSGQRVLVHAAAGGLSSCHSDRESARRMGRRHYPRRQA